MADLRNLRHPPPWNIEQNAYEDWCFEVELWEKCSTLDMKGFVSFSSISSKDTTGAHEKLRLACKNGEIKSENEDTVSQILKVYGILNRMLMKIGALKLSCGKNVVHWI